MRVIFCDDYEEMSRKASAVIVGQLTSKGNSVLGLATGSTPLGLYQKLVNSYSRRTVDFSDCITFNLDEYGGLPPSDPNSYHSFMEKNLFSHINIRPENTHLPDGLATPETACAAYDGAIERAGGIDIQVLGIGYNGHIGFNEPADDFPVTTHVVELTENTRKANARFFNSLESVPKTAITMGIGTIMKSRQILLLANGEGKAGILKRALYGPVTPDVPASILRFHHNVLVIVDREAADLI